MAILIPYISGQYFDSNGDPLNGGKIYAYEAGTTTPKDTFTEQDGNTANANPVILDSAGKADIWLGEGAYKFVITDSADNTIQTIDNVVAVESTAYVADVNSVSTNTNITVDYLNEHVNCTASLTLTLLAAADAGSTFMFSVYNDSSGSVTIDADGSEEINGATTLVLAPGESTLLICDGTEWVALFVSPRITTSSKSSNYTVTTGDFGKTILTNASSGAVTLTLPPAATAEDGFFFYAKKTDSTGNSVIIDGNASETIDGATTYTLANEDDSALFITDGTAWYVIGEKVQEQVAGTLSKSATYTITADDNGAVILCDATSGAFPINLLAAADAGDGYEITIKKIDSSSNAITVTADGSEEIDGSTTKTVTIQYSYVTLVCDATGWHIISEGEIDASQIVSGTVATARLGSGTADSTTYLRGDQTWSEAIPPTTLNAIGTYAIAKDTGGTGVSEGGTISGSNLTRVRIESSGTWAQPQPTGAADINVGTWRNMGPAIPSSGTLVIGLFVRTA